MTLSEDFGWKLLAFRAETNLTARLKGFDPKDAATAEERIRSGLYVIGHAQDQSPHAVRVPPIITEVRTIRDAVLEVSQLNEARSRIYDVFSQVAICGVEARLHNGLDGVKAWVPSKTACPGCIAAC